MNLTIQKLIVFQWCLCYQTDECFFFACIFKYFTFSSFSLFFCFVHLIVLSYGHTTGLITTKPYGCRSCQQATADTVWSRLPPTRKGYRPHVNLGELGQLSAVAPLVPCSSTRSTCGWAGPILFLCRQLCTELAVRFSSFRLTNRRRQKQNLNASGMWAVVDYPSRSQRKELTLSSAHHTPLYFLHSFLASAL